MNTPELCNRCNGTGLEMCAPGRCPLIMQCEDGRGWVCDVNARMLHGCPDCEDCTSMDVTYRKIVMQRVKDALNRENCATKSS